MGCKFERWRITTAIHGTPTSDSKVGNVPAGYVTTYSTTGPADFTFITVKDAGHLVPGYALFTHACHIYGAYGAYGAHIGTT